MQSIGWRENCRKKMPFFFFPLIASYGHESKLVPRSESPLLSMASDENCICGAPSTEMEHVQVSNVFRLFFIPLHSSPTMSLLQCNRCGRRYTEQQWKDKIPGTYPTIAAQVPYPAVHRASATLCQGCSRPMHESWSFCPHCGTSNI